LNSVVLGSYAPMFELCTRIVELILHIEFSRKIICVALRCGERVDERSRVFLAQSVGTKFKKQMLIDGGLTDS
jgi:hypothetical protein